MNVGGSAVSLAATDPVAVSGSGVTLTLAEAVRNGETVTVAYTAPGTGAKLQDADNAKNPVPDFTAQAVTNNTPVGHDGADVRVCVDERDDAEGPSARRWTRAHAATANISVRSTRATIFPATGSSIGVSSIRRHVTFTLSTGPTCASRSAYWPMSIREPPGKPRPLKDLAGNLVAASIPIF